MADKTTGELESVSIGNLNAAPDIYDDLKMPGEMQGDAVHITGAQFKQYAQSATQSFAEYASASAATAEVAKTAAQSALNGIMEALNNLPAGDTLIVNDLTTGGTSAALSAEMGKVLGSRPNPNLLHNWYFANSVNQRGQTEYTAYYTVDGWTLSTSITSVLSVGGEGITLRGTSGIGTVRQYIEFPSDLYGKSVTISVLLSDGSFKSATGHVPSSVAETEAVIEAALKDGYTFRLYMQADGVVFVQLRVPAGGEMTVAAVKLELGDTQTLAHQDTSGKWVLNEIPDYGEELAKCQRYQTDIAGYYPCVQSFGNNGYWFAVQLPRELRIPPNVDLSNAEVMTAGELQTTLGQLIFSGMKGRTLRFAFDMTTPTTLSNPMLYFRTGSLADSNL